MLSSIRGAFFLCESIIRCHLVYLPRLNNVVLSYSQWPSSRNTRTVFIIFTGRTNILDSVSKTASMRDLFPEGSKKNRGLVSPISPYKTMCFGIK